MMYPFMTLEDNTEITHSEKLPDCRVKVYIETPIEGGFHDATCYLPDYKREVHGYSERVPQENGTKIWITRAGKTVVCHNKSNIPQHILNNIRRIIEARVSVIQAKRISQFKEISFYC